MDAQTLATAMGDALPWSDYEALAPPCNAAMTSAGVTTPARAAHWLAQLGHESVGLKFLTEIWGPTVDQSGYEGRRDLGNTQLGDGFRYRGRGAIMLTGRGHYSTLSKWAHSNGTVASPTYFVDHPDALAQPSHCFVGAVWYWTVARPNLNALCDADDLNAVTRAINGGLNGIDDRRARLARCKQLGAALMPTPTASTGYLQPDEILAQLGPGHADWKPLGHDEHGDPLTLRDAVGVIGRGKAETGRLLRALTHQEGTTP